MPTTASGMPPPNGEPRRLVAQSGLLVIGGVLTLDSHPGQGSAFSVTLAFRVPQD